MARCLKEQCWHWLYTKKKTGVQGEYKKAVMLEQFIQVLLASRRKWVNIQELMIQEEAITLMENYVASECPASLTLLGVRELLWAQSASPCHPYKRCTSWRGS